MGPHYVSLKVFPDENLRSRRFLRIPIEFDQKFPELIKNISSEMVQKVAKYYLLSPYLSLVTTEMIMN